MGAIPLFGLNIVAFPVKRLALTVLDQILKGALSTAAKAGIHILGGHTIEDNELKFGLVVSGKGHPEMILQNSQAKPGDVLILTKPLGTGIMTTALKKGILEQVHYEELVDVMTALNDTLLGLSPGIPVHAVTDITGFGLLGHLLEMTRASQVSVELTADHVPLINGVEKYLRSGSIPGGTLQNKAYTEPHLRWESGVDENTKTILNDAQTSGGLLISSPADTADQLLEEIRCRETPAAAIIGKVVPASGFSIIVQ
jgi:selenide,water dikinase